MDQHRVALVTGGTRGIGAADFVEVVVPIEALPALVRAPYAGTKELSCAPEGQPSCTFYP